MGIVRELRATSQIMGPPRDPVIANWFGMRNSASGMNVTPDTALKVSSVYRAVSILAQTYASMPLDVYRVEQDGNKVVDTSHPNHVLLHDQPNKWQTSFEWREMMAGHYALRGRCYSEIISAGGKAIAELVPLHPDRVRPFRAPDGRLAFEYTPIDGPSRIILQSEMHFMHAMTLSQDGVTPLSPITAYREAVGLALATEEHGAKLFSNGTRLGGVLTMQGYIKDDARRKKLLEGFNNAYSGVGNAHKTALLEEGMDWKSLGMTSEDAQFLESRKFQIAEIARIFGIPLHKLAELDRSTNNNIEHQGIEFVQDTILPGATRWEQAIKRDLFFGKWKATHCAEFDLDGLMRGDSAQRAASYASGRQWGYLSANDIRRREKMNPIVDGDIYLQPSNMTAAGTVLTINTGTGTQNDTNP